MGYIDYESTNLHASSIEVLVHYHVRRAALRPRDRVKDPSLEIMDACHEGPLSGALDAIREWSAIWAPQVAPGFDPERGPEIALNLNTTSKGNLVVTWTPIMTQEQFNAGSDGFRRWIDRIDHQPIAQRRDIDLYFIRGFDTLQWHLRSERHNDEVLELSRISAIGLAVMMAELPGKLSHMVRAHWQDALEFGFSESGYGRTPVTTGITIEDMWDRSKRLADERVERAMGAIGIDAGQLEDAWSAVEITNPRVRTDAGRSRAVASKLRIRPEQVDEARAALDGVRQWQQPKTPLWWNRTDPYPHWWGGYRRG